MSVGLSGGLGWRCWGLPKGSGGVKQDRSNWGEMPPKKVGGCLTVAKASDLCKSQIPHPRNGHRPVVDRDKHRPPQLQPGLTVRGREHTAMMTVMRTSRIR